MDAVDQLAEMAERARRAQLAVNALGVGPPDYTEIRPSEAAIAAAQTHSLCRWCEENHFRPYPEMPGRDCLNVKCECWCTTRREERPPR